jgi:glutathione S-transferase
MKLYIADQTCSQAVQIVAHELGLDLDVVHYDTRGGTTSTGEDFSQINPLLYVPVSAAARRSSI